MVTGSSDNSMNTELLQRAFRQHSRMGSNGRQTLGGRISDMGMRKCIRQVGKGEARCYKRIRLVGDYRPKRLIERRKCEMMKWERDNHSSSSSCLFILTPLTDAHLFIPWPQSDDILVIVPPNFEALTAASTLSNNLTVPNAPLTQHDFTTPPSCNGFPPPLLPTIPLNHNTLHSPAPPPTPHDFTPSSPLPPSSCNWVSPPFSPTVPLTHNTILPSPIAPSSCKNLTPPEPLSSYNKASPSSLPTTPHTHNALLSISTNVGVMPNSPVQKNVACSIQSTESPSFLSFSPKHSSHLVPQLSPVGHSSVTQDSTYNREILEALDILSDFIAKENVSAGGEKKKRKRKPVRKHSRTPNESGDALAHDGKENQKKRQRRLLGKDSRKQRNKYRRTKPRIDGTLDNYCRDEERQLSEKFLSEAEVNQSSNKINQSRKREAHTSHE